MKNTKKKGFTIIELVIVIAVIAILAAVLIPTFTNVINNANESKAMQEARNAWTNEVLAKGHEYLDANVYISVGNYNFVVKNGEFKPESVTANPFVDADPPVSDYITIVKGENKWDFTENTTSAETEDTVAPNT